jgi:tetratricopeptide (TPR) repeat protein
VLIGIMTSASLASAQDQKTGLTYLSELSRHNQLPELIQAANALLADPKLTPPEQGIALTYIGHAYQRTGDFHQATTYYEKALAIVNRDNLHPIEYATVLATLGTIYAETDQLDIAKRILHRATDMFEKQNDHLKSSMMWNNLATIASDEHSSREAHKCMARAIAESQLANNITIDEHAALTMTEARIAELDGDPRTAISDYQHALALWKESHNDQQPETAWLYVLLGGAYLSAGDLPTARQMTSQGLHLLEEGSGRQSPRYLNAELAYAKVLDASGDHNEASKYRKEAQTSMDATTRRAQSEISVSALR